MVQTVTKGVSLYPRVCSLTQVSQHKHRLGTGPPRCEGAYASDTREITLWICYSVILSIFRHSWENLISGETLWWDTHVSGIKEEICCMADKHKPAFVNSWHCRVFPLKTCVDQNKYVWHHSEVYAKNILDINTLCSIWVHCFIIWYGKFGSDVFVSVRWLLALIQGQTLHCSEADRESVSLLWE